MAEIQVDVTLPSATSVDVTSPTQALAANVTIPGPQGPRGLPTTINGLSNENIYLSGVDGVKIFNSGVNTIFVSGSGNYFLSSINDLTTNLNLTGSNLQTQINNLDLNYATDAQLQNTGTTLVNSINSLSGTLTGNYYLKSNPSGFITGVDLSSYLTSSAAAATYATITNLASTGLSLQTQIDNLGNTYATDTELSNVETSLDNKISSLSGDAVLLEGNQIIQGQKIFSGSNVALNVVSGASLTVSGNPVLTGVDLSSYATNSNLAQTGSILQNQIDNLDNTYATDIQLQNTGATLQNQINNLGTTYATVSNLANTGSTLNSNINSLSGTLTSTYATITNLALTGSTLTNNINSLSGSLTSDYATKINLATTGSTLESQINTVITNLASTGSNLQTQINNLDLTYATDINLATTGSTLQSNINTLSNNLSITGYNLDNKINALSGSSVLLYGDQTIDGIKTFRNSVYIHDLYVTGTEFIATTENNFVQSPFLLLNLTGGATDGGVFFVTGSGLTGINDLGPIIGFDHTDKFKFGISSRGADLSTLNDIASVQDIQAYSGFVDGKYATIIDLAITGSTLQTNIDNLSTNLGSTGFNLTNKIDTLSGVAVLKYGNQDITGIKTFINDQIFSGNIGVSGTGVFNGLNLDNINSLFLSGMNINITGNSVVNVFNPIRISGNQVLTGVTQDSRAVLTTSNQTIAGIKTFSTEIVTNLIDGADTIFTNALPLIISGGSAFYPNVTGGDVNIIGGGGGGGSGKVNLLSNTNISGILNVAGNILLSGNPVLTGVDLSSYATTANLASTGSTLQTNINNLSGYINSSASNIVFTTGNQTINGLKTFTSGIDIYSGINPQSLRIFNRTGTNSGEFGLFGWQNNQLVIGSTKTNSGIFRDIVLTGANINLYAMGDGTVQGGQLQIPYNTDYNSLTFRNIQSNVNYLQLKRYLGASSGPLLTTLGFTSSISTNSASTADLLLERDAAGVLAQRNSTSSQQFRVYNITGTNTGEFGLFGWINTGLVIGPQQTNSGILRDMTLTGRNININASGVFNIFDTTNIVGNLNVTGNILLSGNSVLTGSNHTHLWSQLTYDSQVGGAAAGFAGRTAGGNLTLHAGTQSTAVPSFYGWDGFTNTSFTAATARTNLGLTSTATAVEDTFVRTTGNQIIGGNKIFTGITTFSGQEVNLVDVALNLSGVGDMTFSGTNINFINSPVYITGTNLRVSGDIYGYNIFVSGNPVLTGIPDGNWASQAEINSLSGNVVFITGNQTISGNKTFSQTGDFQTLKISKNRLLSYDYETGNFNIVDYITIVNCTLTGSGDVITGTLPGGNISGFNHIVKNINACPVVITGSANYTIDNTPNLYIYSGESVELIGVTAINLTGWYTLNTNLGVV